MRRLGAAVMMVVLAGTGSALAEEISVTTYYPSPRGVYEEMRTTGDLDIGTSSTSASTGARLRVIQNQPVPVVRFEDMAGDPTPFLIDASGNVGIGTAAPLAGMKVDVIGTVRGTDLTCADCLNAGDIAANAVGASEIATDAVGPSEIATNAVGSDEIATNAVGSSEIATDAVGPSEIAADAVGSSELFNGGFWSLSSPLLVDSSTLVVHPTLDRVGIGISTPTQKLDVSGNARITGSLTLGPSAQTRNSWALPTSSCYWTHGVASCAFNQSCSAGYYVKGVDVRGSPDCGGDGAAYRLQCCRSY